MKCFCHVSCLRFRKGEKSRRKKCSWQHQHQTQIIAILAFSTPSGVALDHRMKRVTALAAAVLTLATALIPFATLTVPPFIRMIGSTSMRKLAPIFFAWWFMATSAVSGNGTPRIVVSNGPFPSNEMCTIMSEWAFNKMKIRDWGVTIYGAVSPCWSDEKEK